MPITGVETGISATGILLECLLLVAWALRGRHRPFWLVGFYALYHLSFSVCVRLLHLRLRQLSAAVHYGDYALDFVVLAGVIVEVFAYTVRPLASWPRRTRIALIVGLTGGMAIPLLLAMSLRIAGYERIRLWNDRLDLVTSLFLCTLLLISAWVGIRLHAQRSTNAALLRWGLVIWVGTTLMINFYRVTRGWVDYPVFDIMSTASWVVMLYFWLLAVWLWGRSEHNESAATYEPTVAF